MPDKNEGIKDKFFFILAVVLVIAGIIASVTGVL